MSYEMPRVTVLMPVYNGAEYLREAIDSILNQTFTGFEFLIINDGSTDGSIDIVNSCDDPRIRLVNNKKNLKLVATLNRGIDLARGEYIARMDCDDISLPERLSRQVAFMDEHPEYGLCGTNALAVDTGGKIIFSLFGEETLVPIEWTMLWENPIVHPTVMLRKKILQDWGLIYRNIPSEDYDLWCRMVLKTKIVRLPEILLHYRFHNDSAFNVEKNRHLLQAIESSRELAFSIAQRDIPDFHREVTIFPKAMGEQPKYYDIRIVNEWLEILLEKSREMFTWDDSSYHHAKEDCRRLLARQIRNHD